MKNAEVKAQCSILDISIANQFDLDYKAKMGSSGEWTRIDAYLQKCLEL